VEDPADIKSKNSKKKDPYYGISFFINKIELVHEFSHYISYFTALHI